MKYGNLNFEDVSAHTDLVSASTKAGIEANKLEGVLVAEIDPGLSDTAAFCAHYEVPAAAAVNCVIVECRRGERTWYAACMVPADVRADINGVIRRQLDARKISFAAMDKAVGLTGMEFGAITPIGLPQDWPILVDMRASTLEQIIIGSGVRHSKLLVSGQLLASSPNATVISLAKQSD